MLEVHPPEESIHSWRDFFIHIATIVVGLLIAVGLEQTVETIHRAQERRELIETMDHESNQVLREARSSVAAMNQQIESLTARSLVVRDSVWSGKPIPAEIQDGKRGLLHGHDSFDYPDDPLWRQSKAGGVTALLPAEQRGAYAEIELLTTGVSTEYALWQNKLYDRLAFERGFKPLPNGTPDLSQASPEDKRVYLKLLNQELDFAANFRDWNGNLVGAEQAILNGDMKLEDILAAEKQPANMQTSPAH